MNTFETLKSSFSVNWGTIFVGWEGLGNFSPFRWEDFPPLLTLDEVYEYCYDAIAKTDSKEEISLIIDLLEFENRSPDRALVRSLLQPLAKLVPNETAFELRKWRVIMLDEILAQLKNNVVDDLAALSEFWMYFGFPPDSPMKFQGIDNNICPEEFYTDENHKQAVAANKVWVQREKQEIKQNRGR